MSKPETKYQKDSRQKLTDKGHKRISVWLSPENIDTLDGLKYEGKGKTYTEIISRLIEQTAKD